MIFDRALWLPSIFSGICCALMKDDLNKMKAFGGRGSAFVDFFWLLPFEGLVGLVEGVGRVLGRSFDEESLPLEAAELARG